MATGIDIFLPAPCPYGETTEWTCHTCGGSGSVPEHHPDCRGDCSQCPVPVRCSTCEGGGMLGGPCPECSGTGSMPTPELYEWTKVMAARGYVHDEEWATVLWPSIWRLALGE